MEKRWFVLLAAGIILCQTSYINLWSIFQKPLLAFIPGSTVSDIVLVYSLILIFIGVTAPFGGKLMDRFGPRVVVTAGCVMWTLAWYLASFATEMWQLYLTIGVGVGVADGLVYANCVVNTVKWFPDKKGLAGGIIVAFASLGPFIWKPIAMSYFDPAAPTSFYAFSAVIFMVTMVLLAPFVSAPPAGYRPKGWTPPVEKKTGSAREAGPREMVKDPAFYAVFPTFSLAIGSGAVMVGHSAAIAVNQLGMTAADAASTVTVFAFFNMAGRLIWGYLSDRFGRYTCQAAIFAIYCIGAFLLMNASTMFLFMAGCASFAVCWGGSYAVYPAMTSELWGTKNLGVNYGILYLLGPATGSFIFPRIAAKAYEATGSYAMAYYSIIAIAILSFAAMIWLQKRSGTVRNEKISL